MLVAQPVNLKPLGNTVSMTVPAENPFAAGRRITILTQASGGMAQADPSQRSRRVRTPFNGLGGLGAAPVSYDEVFSWYASIDPDGKAGKPITPEKEAYWRAQVQADADKKEATASAQSSANWNKAADIFTTTLNAGANVAGKVLEARKAASDAQAANSMSLMSRLSPTNLMANMSQRKSITLPLLAVGGAALAIALFLFLKKKNAAPAAA
jgi:hypothetical protein